MRMAWLGGMALCAVFTAVQAEIKTEEVSYKDGDTVMKGFIAYDDAIKTKRPGVLVVHEWWGHNEYARKRARMLAELGYTALALDMYGDGKQAHHPEQASQFSSAVSGNMPLATSRFNAARSLLVKHASVDSKKVAAIGYCFGGGVILEMARNSADLAGVVSFHGSLATSNPAKPGAVKAKVLVLNGADDPFVKKEQIDQIKVEMEKAGASYQFVSYPGAKHSFTNPDADKYGKEFKLPLEYNAKADQESWVEMQTFFKKIF